MRAGIATRVSLDPRGEGRSVAEQETESRAWARRENWDVVEVIQDEGSASRYARSTQARTRWDDVINLIASGRIDILLTWEASRATRQLEEYAQLRDLCARHGVLWGYSGTVYDLTQRADRFRTGLDMLVAEDESARTSERVLRAARARAAAGTPHGKLLYGYRREYDPTTGALLRQVPDETTAPIAREIITRIADGETMYRVAADLTDRAIPLPRPARARHRATEWIPTTVKRIAANPAYAGRRVHQGVVIGDAAWPALVDVDVHERALASLEDRNARAVRADRSVKWLCSGVARCGVCGGPMVHHLNRGRYGSYTCKDRSCLTRKREWVDEHVVGILLGLLAHVDATDTTTDDPAIAQARSDADALRTRLEGFIDQAADGSLSPAALARVEAKLRPQIDVADRKVRALQRPTLLAHYDLTDPVALWDELDIAARRQLLADVVTITVHPTQRGARSFDPATVEVRPRW